MYMGIYKSRRNISALHIDFFNAKIGASTGNIAIGNGYITQNKFSRIHMEHFSIF